MGRRSASPRRSRSRSPRRSRPRSRSRSNSRGGRGSPPPKRSRSRSRGGDRGRAPRSRSRSRDRRRERSRGRDRGDRRARSRSPDRGRGGDRREPISLLVRNLSPETSQDELRRAFSRRAGDILDVYIPKEYSNNRPRGFAFIEFADARVGRDVKFEMDRTQLGGREIAVLFAKQHRKSPQEMRRILNLPTEGSPKRSPRRRSKSRSGSPKRRSASPGDKREAASPRASPSPRRASPSPKREGSSAGRSPSADGAKDDETMSEVMKSWCSAGWSELDAKLFITAFVSPMVDTSYNERQLSAYSSS
ncbi:Serine/arginine-rich splicing factor 10 [Phytophthora pseudosyringae]|uniref:Serine/arginine-rich splicing factor 10 n=1 Tax=Phytophthora pseudosyringae TaxID=221518 RepID=A0A8T1W0V8_9STRA|nr:Serine/arginine-rich splicing factor 10 [Phytophthora pseudosyringae]